MTILTKCRFYLVSAPTSHSHPHSNSPVLLPVFDTPLSAPAHSRPHVPVLHTQSCVPPPLQIPASQTASIRTAHKPSSTSTPFLPSPVPSTPLSETDIAPSRSDAKPKNKGKGKARASTAIDDSIDVLIVDSTPDLTIVDAGPTPPIGSGERTLRARHRPEETVVEKADAVTKAKKKADKKADKKTTKEDTVNKKLNKGTTDVTVDTELQVVRKPKPKKQDQV